MKLGFFFLIRIITGSTIIFTANNVLAQITPDTTLPNNSQVRLQNNIQFIEGGTQAGSNLFHSFKEFSVPMNGTAYFNNQRDIQNIVTRVTGETISNIDGLIRANENANLFLINPNGIVFGQNARLDIGGSFIGSTANSLKFADGFEFSAVNPQSSNPLLTINVPIGLQLGNNPGNIVNQSQGRNDRNQIVGLTVSKGKTLALVGGNVSLDAGRLTAPGGQVQLGGLATEGTVGLQLHNNNLSLNFPNSVVRSDISLNNQSRISTTSDGGGSIAVNAGNLNVLGGSRISTGIETGTDAVGKQAGDINLNATGETQIDGQNTRIENNVNNRAVGNSGNVNIITHSLRITNGAQLSTSTFGGGNAGNVDVRASNLVELIDSGIFSAVGAGGVGKGGNININAASLSLKDGSQLITVVREASNNQAAGRGDAGNVKVDVTGAVTISGVKNKFTNGIFSQLGTGAVGNGGNINISSGLLSLSDSSALSASTLGEGNAGNVDVRASNLVELIDSDISSAVGAGGVGKGGNININAASLSLKGRSQLITVVREASNNQAAGRGDAGNVKVDVTGAVTINGVKNKVASGIRSELRLGAVGNGGNINISSGSLSLSDGAALVSSTFGEGNAGNVDVRASDFVELINNSGIFSTVEAGGVGKGGNININASSLSLKNSSQLQTIVSEASDKQPAGQGNAGNVKVDVTGAVIIAGKEGTSTSGIGSQLGTGAVGNGGNINISSGSLSLSDDARLSASTFGQGNAGNIKIDANNFVNISGRNLTFGFNSSLFVDSSGFGRTGDIEITSPIIRLENEGRLIATSTSGNGGNIRLNPTNLLLLDNNSLISATAGTQQQAGDGGNITIKTPNGFIVGFPNGNNDIIANAFKGTGGKIIIDAFGIFGMQPRTREELQRLNQLNPEKLPTNDITAFSEQNPSLSGIVQINTPDVDPNRGVAELPQYLVNAAGLINQNFCARAYNSSFIITGRGGIAPTPFDVFTAETAWEDWRLNPSIQSQRVLETEGERLSEENEKVSPTTATSKIVEAQGWIVNNKGQVELVAFTSHVTPHLAPDILKHYPNGCLPTFSD
ncbi:MAG: filamentous hemagglutinin N-terminal domain-containing protein [Scytonematopsis contorta HA4267-MV1]|jgi:filamentous hemagglutinin family protein|nr:filamentous hemagglutinin N-terminal domain-containing protein [Scytonematopsis contorta HA4267-MV1]